LQDAERPVQAGTKHSEVTAFPTQSPHRADTSFFKESKIYLGRLVQNKFWTPNALESKIYLGHIIQNGLVYKDERRAWER